MNNHARFQFQLLKEYMEEEGEAISDMVETHVLWYSAWAQGWQNVVTSLQTGKVWGRPASGEKMTEYMVDISEARSIVSAAVESLP